jgi:aminoglycoside phosphotransferase (APT) family kinase protein
MTAASLAERLRCFLAESAGDPEVTVVGMTRSGEGNSRENWPFEANWSHGSPWPRRMLLRRDPTGGVLETSRRQEFDLLTALAPSGLPVPRVLWFDETGEHFERPSMIVEMHPGRAHRGVLGRADPMGLGDDGRLALARQLCELLAGVHRLDPAAIGIDRVLPRSDRSPAEDQLEIWSEQLGREELEPQPALRLVAMWLADHLPDPPERTVLVHGDFRPGNVLVDGGAATVLLDWELARIGDPLDDLGWYTTGMYRREHFIPGAWELPDFLRHYRALTGTVVDPEALRFWEIMAGFRLVVMAVAGVSAFVDGRSNRPARRLDTFAARLLAACG